MLELAIIIALFAAAWLVSRLAAYVARRVLRWHDRRHEAASAETTAKITNIKRRETTVAVIRTTIAYAAFGAAALVSVAQLAGGFDRLTTLAGASLLLVTVGFALQRLVGDLVAGLAMVVERWDSVGDTILLHAGTEQQGGVEDVSLRRTKLRALNGEAIHVHNSQITSVRVLPRGVHELAIELFVTKQEAGEKLVEDVARLVPEGPTTFVKRPSIQQVEELSDALTHISLRATVAPGREWLAENFFADLLREKAPEGVIVHGPVALAVDERATRSFARASAATRWSERRAQRESTSAA